MVTTPKCTSSPHCECGSELVVTSGAGRVTLLRGAAVAVPEEMRLLRCPSCRVDYPTAAETEWLECVADRDWLGDGGRSSTPVLRGT